MSNELPPQESTQDIADRYRKQQFEERVGGLKEYAVTSEVVVHPGGGVGVKMSRTPETQTRLDKVRTELGLGKDPEEVEEKTKEWEEKTQEINEIADATGRGIDEGIKETIVAFNLMDIPTSQSCEGHDEMEGGHRLWPWVEISAPNEPEERFEGENQLFEEAAEAHGMKVEDLKRGSPEELFWAVKKRASQNPVTPEYQAWEELNSQLYAFVLELLNEFYKDREVQEDIKLELDENNGGSFEISNEKAALLSLLDGQLTDEEKRYLIGKLPKRREEMKAFTEFLKERFFER